jgi:hypothetical protein
MKRDSQPRRLDAALAVAGSFVFYGTVSAQMKFEPMERTFSGVTGYSEGTEYSGVSCDAVFGTPTPLYGISTGSTNRKVPLFWDGERTWKLRVVGRVGGTYSYTLHCIPTSLSIHGQKGTFVVNGTTYSSWTGGEGFVRRRGAYLTRDNGNTFLYLADTQWRMDSSSPFSTTIGINYAKWKKIIDDRATRRFTVIQMSLHPDYLAGRTLTNSTGTDVNQIPFGPSCTGALTNCKINPSYFQALDERVEYVVSKGLVLSVAFGWGSEFFTSTHGFGGSGGVAAAQRYARYVMARYAAYNVIWMTLGEYQEIRDSNMTKFASFIDYVRAIDPHNHLVTGHPIARAILPLDSTITGKLDFVGGQETDKDALDANGCNTETATDNFHLFDDARSGRTAAGTGKGYVNLEFGYERRISPTKDACQAHDQLPRDIVEDVWGLMLGGAAGVGYGNRHVWKEADTSRLSDMGAQYMTHLYNFWTDATAAPAFTTYTEFVKTGSKSTSWMRACKQTGPDFQCTAFLVGADSTGSWNTTATGPKVRAGTVINYKWYNILTGEWRKNAATRSGYNSVAASPTTNFTAPSTADDTWVLFLKGTTSFP